MNMDWITALVSLLSAIIGGCIGSYAKVHSLRIMRKMRERDKRRAIARKIRLLKPAHRRAIGRLIAKKNSIFVNGDLKTLLDRESTEIDYLCKIGFVSSNGGGLRNEMGETYTIIYTLDDLVADVYCELFATEVAKKKTPKPTKGSKNR